MPHPFRGVRLSARASGRSSTRLRRRDERRRRRRRRGSRRAPRADAAGAAAIRSSQPGPQRVRRVVRGVRSSARNGQPNRASIARSVSRWPPDAAGSMSTAPSGVHCRLPFQRSPWMRAGGSSSSRSPRGEPLAGLARRAAGPRRRGARAPPRGARTGSTRASAKKAPHSAQPSGRVGSAWFADERRPVVALRRHAERGGTGVVGRGERRAERPRVLLGRPGRARAPRGRCGPARPRRTRTTAAPPALREPGEAGRLRLEEAGGCVGPALRVDASAHPATVRRPPRPLIRARAPRAARTAPPTSAGGRRPRP